jgi:DGQHR domain-containing protein
MTTYRFPAIVPQQNPDLPVFSFAASAKAVLEMARIERVGRDDDGALSGFQRPQIANHIREIRDYLERPTAILPNSIVIAFTSGVRLDRTENGIFVEIDTSAGPSGWVVDGQQRLSALTGLPDRDFELLVSGFVCDGAAELHKQFILINNTRPLPKALVYELLPGVTDLPPRMSSRARAALLTEALNYRRESSLRGLINQQTNPDGMIRDTALQKMLMNSMSDGALRLYGDSDQQLLEHGVKLVSEFFAAVQDVFRDAWEGHTPKSSRLVHGAGIMAMGYVMDTLVSASRKMDRESFADGLQRLVGATAWTSGEWNFGRERRPWNRIQVINSDVRILSHYLVQQVRRPVIARAAN